MLVTEQRYEEVKEKLAKADTWTIDVETNGLDPFNTNQICGLGIGVLEGETFYFPFRHQQEENLPFPLQKDIIALANTRKTLIGYNLKFDLHFLQLEGLEVEDKKLIDVIVMVRLTEPSEENDMALSKTIVRSYGSDAAAYDVETKKFLRANKWHKDFSEAPPSVLGPYCEQDVSWTTRLYLDRLERIKQSKQEQVFELECNLTKVLYNMEQLGITVDNQYAINAQQQIEERRNQLEQKIHGLVGEFNINSTQQLCEVMNNNGIYSPILTPKGVQSWGEAALIQINNPLAGFVRQYRALGKLYSTYLEPYTEKQVMHTSFCNWGTLTGRLSSREPNLQNIPRNHFKLSDTTLTEEQRKVVMSRINALIASKGGAVNVKLDDNVIDTWGFIGDESYSEEDTTQIAVRRLFMPRKDYSLVSFDYSQMEVRVFLSYFQNDEIKALLERSDTDFHGEAAKMAFHVEEDDEQFKFYRQMAKAVTFGTIYGIGSKKFAVQLGTTPAQALQYKKQYFAGLKGSKEFFDQVVQAVTIKGQIKNRYGRVYKIPKDLGYKGVNYLVQGTSADILSERMIEVEKYLKTTQSRLLLQVHDEIICEIHNKDLNTVPYNIQNIMQQNSLNIPLYVDMELCDPSWATKKELTIEEEYDIISDIDWD